jgi:hypothetical protein
MAGCPPFRLFSAIVVMALKPPGFLTTNNERQARFPHLEPEARFHSLLSLVVGREMFLASEIKRCE